MTNPADIARALSEGQKDWLTSECRFADGCAIEDGNPIWDGLAKLGLSEYWTDRLTPLGLAVRDHLLHRPTASDASTDRTPATVDGCGRKVE